MRGRKASEKTPARSPKLRELEYDDEALYGEPLPDGVLPDADDWHPITVRWWDSLRRNPLMREEPPMGWDFLLDTALMHHRMWTTGRFDMAGEVRQRVAKFGVTPEDRLRLRITIKTNQDLDEEDEQTLAVVEDIQDRRKKIMGA